MYSPLGLLTRADGAEFGGCVGVSTGVATGCCVSCVTGSRRESRRRGKRIIGYLRNSGFGDGVGGAVGVASAVGVGMEPAASRSSVGVTAGSVGEGKATGSSADAPDGNMLAPPITNNTMPIAENTMAVSHDPNIEIRASCRPTL